LKFWSEEKDHEYFNWGMNIGFILMAALLLIWALMSPIVLDLTGIGFGYVDPLFMLFLLWLIVVFIVKMTIPNLQKKSIQGLSEEWKGPLVREKANTHTGPRFHKGALAARDVCLRATGGTSKPAVEGFTGVRVLFYPPRYSIVIGDHHIIMTLMRTYRGDDHSDIMPHVMGQLMGLRKFIRGETKVCGGEEPDPKFAVWNAENNQYEITEGTQTGASPEDEASKCRQIYGLHDEKYRLMKDLKRHGQELPEG